MTSNHKIFEAVLLNAIDFEHKSLKKVTPLDFM